jgi:hypothetical protein
MSSNNNNNPILNFLSFTAQIPLNEGEDLRSSEAKGFTKTKLTKDDVQPAFDGSKCFSYAVTVPKGTTHVGVMATSFSGCALKINDTNGNMSVVELSQAKNAIKVTLHETADADEAKTTYEIRVHVSEETAKDGEVVMKEKEVPEDQKVVHTHSHDGVPCTHDHGHSHDGVPCDKDHSKDGEEHGHGHGHGHKKHAHSHDGVPCDKDHSKDGEEHGHGHSHHGHGHGHGEEKKKEEEHGHGHSHHSHGHGHGEEKKKEEEHGHGHSHHSHGHGHGEEKKKEEEHGHCHAHKH